MNVALLADTAWLDEELNWFQHLVVGLLDERVRVVEVTPQELAREASSLFTERVAWSESRWAEVNRWRLARLDESLEAAGVHLIHALDSRLWRGAAALGEEMSVPVVFSANSVAGIEEADKLVRTADPSRIAFAAATQPIADALRHRLANSAAGVHIEVVPTGVHLGEPPPGCEGQDSLCAIVSGNGKLDDDYRALLQGMVEAVKRHPHMQFFFDGQGSDQHQLWKAASKLGLLQNISLIPRRLGHRELLLRADALIQPQPLGQARSITLQAMAHALTVVAHEDPWLDYLQQDQTAWLLHEPDPHAWTNALQRVVEEPQAANGLGERARNWVRERRLVSDQVSRTLNLYRRLTGATIRFGA